MPCIGEREWALTIGSTRTIDPKVAMTSESMHCTRTLPYTLYIHICSYMMAIEGFESSIDREAFMIQQKLRKVGNSYVVTIPKDEVERLGIEEGQMLAVEIQPLELRPVMRPEVREAFERSWNRSEKAYRYLADR